MKFGIGMFGDVTYDFDTKTYQDSGTRLQEIVEEVKLADELGIDIFAIGEHHREDYAVPAPEIMLAALSTVTKNIILSSGVNIISSADPVKLYQDYSMIDLLTNSRAEIMAGRGSFIESFPLFGNDLKNYNELFEEKLELLLIIRENDVVNWKGRFRPAIENQTVFPRPNRKIPINIAVGGTPASVERAGRLGLPITFAIIGGTLNQFVPLINYYKEAYEHYGHDPKNMEIGVHSHTFIGNKDWIMDNYYARYAHQMDKIGRERGWTRRYSKMQFENGMDLQGALFMGEAEAVAEKIIHTVELFGLKRFIAHLDNGGPKHSDLMKCIELYGGEVLPMVRKHFQ